MHNGAGGIESMAAKHPICSRDCPQPQGYIQYIPKIWKLQDMYEKAQVLFMYKSSVQTLAQVVS
jgi:hypothetical protein